ncbi:MAG TPA: topoisomerase C-terminal repeat-containing protein, partial [Sphingomonadales bacterium]|nr:topoisomerase C-terminal repeat-containing protein [Sphingomonadales bacterium]
TGRFGPYIQLGEAKEKGEKPKRAPIPRDKQVADIDLEAALKLLSMPVEVGVHPETGKPITASIGRYGPYVAHDGKFASLASSDEVFEVGVNRAVALLAERKSGNQRRGSTTIKDLGPHPEDGKAVKVLDGRYGPYVNHGKVNATVPKGTDPETLSLDQGLELLAARKAKAKKS